MWQDSYNCIFKYANIYLTAICDIKARTCDHHEHVKCGLASNNITKQAHASQNNEYKDMRHIRKDTREVNRTRELSTWRSLEKKPHKLWLKFG